MGTFSVYHLSDNYRMQGANFHETLRSGSSFLAKPCPFALETQPSLFSAWTLTLPSGGLATHLANVLESRGTLCIWKSSSGLPERILSWNRQSLAGLGADHSNIMIFCLIPTWERNCSLRQGRCSWDLLGCQKFLLVQSAKSYWSWRVVLGIALGSIMSIRI